MWGREEEIDAEWTEDWHRNMWKISDERLETIYREEGVEGLRCLIRERREELENIEKELENYERDCETARREGTPIHSLGHISFPADMAIKKNAILQSIDEIRIFAEMKGHKI